MAGRPKKVVTENTTITEEKVIKTTKELKQIDNIVITQNEIIKNNINKYGGNIIRKLPSVYLK